MSQTNGMKQFVSARKNLLKLLQSIPEHVVDVQPTGFNNTIHWNAGHILIVAEQFLFGITKEQVKLPTDYKTFFGNGTRPSEWNGEAPSYATLVSQLEDQLTRVQTALANRLDEALEKPFILGSTGLQFDTIGEVLNLAVYHEASHTGFINAFRRVAEANV